jgi:hypothetical protein
LAPLTFGILHPVILMPKVTDWNDETALQYILAHEYVHIRRFDTVSKLALTAAVCVHWFNPLVWVMYVLANRDLELSCDESVIRLFGENTKSDYARTLISMEETRSGLTPLCNSFSKNAIEERIVAIMKMKKTSWASALVALTLVAGVTTAFATTGQTAAANSTEDTEGVVLSYVSQPDNDFNDSEEIEWWTAEEYEQWMEEQKQEDQSIIGNLCWNPTEGWFTWDQAHVDEAVASMEQVLEEIRDGKKVSKPTQDGDTAIQFSSDETATKTVYGIECEFR